MKKLFITTLFLLSVTFMLAQQSGKYTVKNLDVNTENSDFGTSFYKNKQVVFASPKEKTFWSTIVKNVWKQNGQRFLDLYVAEADSDGQLINKMKINPDVNSKYHEATVAFTKDFKTVYFTRNNYYNDEIKKDSTGMTNLALYSATVGDDGKWTNITPLPFNNKDYSVGHPALSGDNKKLYFVSDMPGGKGKTDIYEVNILGNNTFSTPVNLEAVNTPEREMFPYVADNNVLYFSSDCPQTKGGLDIFAYNFTNSKIALDAPLNSVADDFAFIIDSTKKSGYFSSNRDAGKGDDDIYYFVEDKPIEFECKQYIVLNVIDAETKQPISGAQLNVIKNGAFKNEFTLDATGTYKTDAKCNEDYKFKASMDKYFAGETYLKTNERNEYTNTIDLALKPIPKVVEPEQPRYILGPVYFDFDKFNIRKSIDADQELDRIVDILNKNPNMIVSIESFTDSRGDDIYNGMLSQSRAESTKNYMVAKGIAAERIVGVLGRGEQLPVNQCTNGVKCTEAEHQLNRRTEFVVVKQ